MYTTLLFFHFIGLALGLGTGFANFTLGRATADMLPSERAQFFLRAFALSKNGSVGLLLLIVTGLGLMFLRGVGATLALGGAVHAKLTLVVLMMGALGYLQMLIARAKREQGGPTMAKIPKAGAVMLVLALATVACAVIAFH